MPDAPTLPTTPPAAPTDRALPCVGCRYNLRGAAPDGHCPECGTPIEHSLAYAEIHGWGYPPPRWLGRLRRATLIAWALDLLALASMATVLAYDFTGQQFPVDNTVARNTVVGIIMGLFVPFVISVSGLAAREPGRAPPPARGWSWLAQLGVLGLFLAPFVNGDIKSANPILQSPPGAGWLAMLVLAVAMAPPILASWLLLRCAAARVRALALATWCRRLAMFLLVAALSFALVHALLCFHPPRDPAGAAAYQFAVRAARCLLLAYWALAALVLWGLQRAFAEARQHALQAQTPDPTAPA